MVSAASTSSRSRQLFSLPLLLLLVFMATVGEPAGDRGPTLDAGGVARYAGREAAVRGVSLEAAARLRGEPFPPRMAGETVSVEPPIENSFCGHHGGSSRRCLADQGIGVSREGAATARHWVVTPVLPRPQRLRSTAG